MESKTKEWFRKENLLPLLGPCLLIFSVPLLVSGLTLTMVAFTDQTGFPKYGAVHVLGMVLLAVSGLLLVAGCGVKLFACKDGARVGPDEEEGLHSSSSLQDSSSTVGHVRVSTHSSDKHSAKTSARVKMNTVSSGISGHLDSSNDNEEEEEKEEEDVIRSREKTDSLYPPPPLVASWRDNDLERSVSQSVSSTETSSTPSPVRLPHIGQRAAASVNAATVARAARSEQEASSAASLTAAERGMPVLEPTGTVGERKETTHSSKQRGYNFMMADSEDERREADTYSKAAQMFPTDSKGLIRGMSTVSTNSSSSLSPAHSLYESFDVEQHPADADRVRQGDPQTQRPGPPELLQRRAVDSRTSLGQSTMSSIDQPPSKRNEEFQLESLEPKRRGSGDFDGDMPGRLFLSRERRVGRDHHDNFEINEAKHASRTGDPELGSYRANELRDVSSSSFEKQASSIESPSHGTYSVKSALSEELLEFKESPSGLQDEGDFSSSYLINEKYDETDHRPMSPVPDQIDDDRDGQTAILGGSLERMVKSSSSLETSQEAKLASPGNTTVISQSGEEEVPTQKAYSDDYKAEQESKRKKKKKKKKKKKHKDQSVIDENEGLGGDLELEAELIRVQQDRQKQSVPIRSIMHPIRNPEHHVHFPDAESIQ